MNKVMLIIVFVLAACLVSGVSQSSAQAPNLTGQWEMDASEDISCHGDLDRATLDGVETEPM